MRGTPILCYHKVGDEGRSLNVAEADFRKQIGFLRRRGYRFGLLRDFPSLPQRSVVLTFDDVYVSTAECLLRCDGLTGTLFPVPAHVGGTSAWDGEKARPLADWSALERLHRTGWEIGNHTIDHVDLAAATDVEVEHQLRGASALLGERFAEPPPLRLEAQTLPQGERVGTCAYPYGRYDQRAVRVLEELGYTAAVTVKTGVAKKTDNRLELPRLMIAYSDRVAGLIYKLYLRPLLK